MYQPLGIPPEEAWFTENLSVGVGARSSGDGPVRSGGHRTCTIGVHSVENLEGGSEKTKM